MAQMKVANMLAYNPPSSEGHLDTGGTGNKAEKGFYTAPMSRVHLGEVISLLQEISVFEPATEEYEEIWSRFNGQINSHPLVALSGESVVAFGVLLIENKVRGGKMGHIEDIVSHPDVRGLGAGRLVVRELSRIAESLGCYKVALHCQDHNVGFYEKQGLTVNGKSMQKLL